MEKPALPSDWPDRAGFRPIGKKSLIQKGLAGSVREIECSGHADR